VGETERDLARSAAELLSSAARGAFARGDGAAAANLLERAASLLPPEDLGRRRAAGGRAVTAVGAPVGPERGAAALAVPEGQEARLLHSENRTGRSDMGSSGSSGRRR
jgi:hypothetical protein